LTKELLQQLLIRSAFGLKFFS